jgi:hypothetical protein
MSENGRVNFSEWAENQATTLYAIEAMCQFAIIMLEGHEKYDHNDRLLVLLNHIQDLCLASQNNVPRMGENGA